MKKFIKICKAILPQCFRVAHWHLSFHWLQTAYFPMFVSLESHAIKHYRKNSKIWDTSNNCHNGPKK